MSCWTRLVMIVGLLAAFVVGAGASAQVVETQLMARGATAEAAVARGVVDAVRRVNEPRVAFDQARKQRFEDSVKDLDSVLSASDLTVQRMQAESKSLSRGLVESLKVLDQRAVPEGSSIEVTLRVGVAPFAEALASRKTIAITTFQTSTANFGFAGSPIEGRELTRKLADATIERMVQAGVLTVLDRQHVEEVARERNFVELYGRNSDELSRFGKMLGADYLLVGTIETAGLEIATETVKASGYSFQRAFAGMEVKARLLAVETGAIAWADTIRVTFTNSDLNRMFPGGTPEVPGTAAELIEDAAAQLTEAIVEAIAPIKVALVDGETIWVNRGLGRLSAGTRLMIRGGGQDVRDPDTGESLGPAERTVAVVEVVAVDAKKSQCRVIEGKPEAIQVGQVARPMTPVR